MHKKSPIWSSILVSWGKLPTLKFDFYFVWSVENCHVICKRRKINSLSFFSSIYSQRNFGKIFDGYRKGQIKPKAVLACSTFSPKWTNQFVVLFAVKSKKANKTNSVVHFLGRIYGAPICFRFYLTFRATILTGSNEFKRLLKYQFSLFIIGFCRY